MFIMFLAIANLLFLCPAFADTIQVMTTDGANGDGSLNAALAQALDGDIIDCSPIAGQTIDLTSHLPAIGSITILGSGVTIDGGSMVPVFSVAQGSATITDFTIQNGLCQGGNGGIGKTGGGGGTGGGGALYVHSGSTLTISTINLNNNQAVGGAGGIGSTGGSGGGGGGFGGGRGGSATRTGAIAGSGGGGGGNNGGANGGPDAGAGSPNTFSNYAGAGGGGQRPGLTHAGNGGTVAATATGPARTGGAGGMSNASYGGGAGGGAGSGGNGNSGSDATLSAGGVGGAGGLGVGADNTYGAGGGGGGGTSGGAGYGTSGGGGGLNGPGGAGGVLGGGGGASGTSSGGNGGFGAGGGAGVVGGVDTYGLGGAGGSATGTSAGGGGGSGLGGAIFVQKEALLIVQDGISFSGNSTAAGIGGTAAGSSGQNGSSLGQDIFIQSGGSVTFQVDGTITLSNPIQGAGLLVEATGPGVVTSGMGTVSLTGDNTYLGGTLIQAGTLNLNGSVAQDVNIQLGGTLSGNATVNGNISNNGTLSPGNSIGQISTTDLQLYPSSVYTVEINSAGQSDTIIASGSAQVDGTVAVSPDDVHFTTPLTYTIISTDAGVTGQFSSLTSSVPAVMSLIYNPLTVELVYLPLNVLGLACNEQNAASCFVTLSGSDAATINNALLALDFDGIKSAFQQMGPAQFSGPTEVQLLDAILVRYTYTKRLQQLCSTYNRPVSFWVDMIAQWQYQGKQFGYKDTTLGATVGVDYCIHNWVLGGAFSFTHDDFYWNHFGGNAQINSYYGGLYSQWNHNACMLRAALVGASNNYKTRRQIGFGTIDRCAHSKHLGNEWLAHLGFEYKICPTIMQVIPYVNFDYVFVHEKSYTETGADSLDLRVKAKNSMLFQSEAGFSLSNSYQLGDGLFIPMLTLAYMNQTPCTHNYYYASFVDSCCVFNGKGGNYERNLFIPRLAFTYQDGLDRVSASIYYDGQFGNKYWAQDVIFNLTIRF